MIKRFLKFVFFFNQDTKALKEIQHLIRFVAKSGASEVKLETADVKITIKTSKENETTFVQQVPVAAQPQQITIPTQQHAAV